MWPLLRKDGLATQYIAHTLLWNRLIGHSPFISLRQATFLDVFTCVRQFLPFIPTSAYSTLRCVGGLFGMRSTSPVGVCISTTGTIPRLIPRPQRTSEHAGFHLNLVVEYQVYHRGAVDRWWTQGQ
jgi:hypothetical protein